MLSSPLLSKPVEGKLMLYLPTSQRVIYSMLVQEEENVQYPMYYVGKALKDVEMRYTPLEKVVQAFVVTAQKLVPYFLVNSIHVLTVQPLGSVLKSSTSSDQIVKWAMELTQYGIEYRPRPSIKAQALPDFIVECTSQESEGEHPIPKEGNDWWELNANGVASLKHCDKGIMLTSSKGLKLYYALVYQFKTSNNEAKYVSVIGELRLVIGLKVTRICIRIESRLVAGQLEGSYEAKENMKLYKDVAKGLLVKFKVHEIHHVLRKENKEVDYIKTGFGLMLEHLAWIRHTEIVQHKSTQTLVVCQVCAPQLCTPVNHVAALARQIVYLKKYIEIDNLLGNRNNKYMKAT